MAGLRFLRNQIAETSLHQIIKNIALDALPHVLIFNLFVLLHLPNIGLGCVVCMLISPLSNCLQKSSVELNLEAVLWGEWSQ